MRYLSVCSGIEAASVAWAALEWRAVGVAETAAFPRAVLAHHFPDVPNFGDLTGFKGFRCEPFDLLVGGTPCQSFSVAGLRKGLADPRGNLALVYLALAELYRPEWIVWENVPGVLSSNGGRDFGTFLGALAQLGYGFAYRVLDAQYVRVDGFERAVPQRRRRVFVVGNSRDWRRAAAVLFEPESLRGDSPPRREAGQEIAGALGAGSPRSGGRAGRRERFYSITPSNSNSDYNAREAAKAQALTANGNYPAARGGDLVAFGGNNQSGAIDVATCRTAHTGGHGRLDFESETFVCVPIAFDCKAGGSTAFAIGEVPGALRGEGFGGGHAAIAFDTTQITSRTNRCRPEPGDPCHPVTAAGHPPSIAMPHEVRRLTPRECERLQGFPDDYTLIPYRGRPAADAPRYKAIGNAMAVNVMRWLGTRIAMIDILAKGLAA